MMPELTPEMYHVMDHCTEQTLTTLCRHFPDEADKLYTTHPASGRRPGRPFAPGRVHHIGGGIGRHGGRDGERHPAHRHERAFRLHPHGQRDRRLPGGDLAMSSFGGTNAQPTAKH